MNITLSIYESLSAGFYGLLMVVAAVAPVLWVCRAEIRRARDPQYWRRVGVVVLSLSALDAVAEEIGRYMNATIYGQVVFKGIAYQFDRVTVPAYKEWVRPTELYMEPGIVYVAQR
jgi:hypothetical protein